MSASAHLLEYFRSQKEDSIRLLRQLVEMESFSFDKPGVDRLADFVAERFRQLGAECRVISADPRGNLLKAIWPGNVGLRPVMVLGHLDTVWPPGTLAERPFRVEGDRAFGPGVFDMKAGLLISLLTCQAFSAGHVSPGRDVVFLFTSDEEIGTEAGRPLLLSEASRCLAVLCLEPPLPGGKAKTFRKGVGTLRLRVAGVSAHAGLNHEKGANAVTELCRQILRLHGMTDYNRGVTISVGKISGGTAVNVVPSEAEAEIDFRFTSQEDGLWIENEVRSFQTVDTRCRLYWDGGMNRPPLVRTDKVAALFNLARGVASELGMTLGEGPSGGGSDGSFTASAGVPTLDGLGVEGDGAHAVHEHVILSDIAWRAAFLSSLIKSVDE